MYLASITKKGEKTPCLEVKTEKRSLVRALAELATENDFTVSVVKEATPRPVKFKGL